MRKLFVGLLALAVMATVAGSVFADGLVQDPKRRVSTYTYVKLLDDALFTSKAVSEIVPGDRILGWSVSALSKTAGCQAAIYDCAAVGDVLDGTAGLSQNMINEAEVGPDDSSNLVWFAYPKDVTTGVVLAFAEAAGVMTVFYEDVSAY